MEKSLGNILQIFMNYGNRDKHKYIDTMKEMRILCKVSEVCWDSQCILAVEIWMGFLNKLHDSKGYPSWNIQGLFIKIMNII